MEDSNSEEAISYERLHKCISAMTDAAEATEANMYEIWKAASCVADAALMMLGGLKE